jgi:hypothetical protein
LPEYFVPEGTPMQVKKSGAGEPVSHTSKKKMFVQQGQLIDGGNRMRFYSDGYQIECQLSGIFHLKLGKWIGGKPKLILP